MENDDNNSSMTTKFLCFLKSKTECDKDNNGKDFNDIYMKNVALLKRKLQIKVLKILPNSSSLQQFISCSSVLDPKSLSKAFVKKKVLILLMISFYEYSENKNQENFDNSDWEIIASLSPNFDLFTLKFKWFLYLSPLPSKKIWTYEQDNLLWKTLKIFHARIFKSKQPLNEDISWAKIAFEMSKTLQSVSAFKTDKQCKERWHNHLNPFLKREPWTTEEDAKLLELYLKFSQKWAQITRKFSGRNQHQIKNRFFHLICKEMSINLSEVRKMISENNITIYIQKSIENLKKKSKENYPIKPKKSKKSNKFEKKIPSLKENILTPNNIKKEIKEESTNLNLESVNRVNLLPSYNTWTYLTYSYMMGCYLNYLRMNNHHPTI